MVLIYIVSLFKIYFKKSEKLKKKQSLQLPLHYIGKILILLNEIQNKILIKRFLRF